MAISLAGLSATYPGYGAQQKQDASTADSQASATSQTIDNQIKARDAAIKMLGANALGAALQGGPQAPPPGQASVAAPQPPSAPVAAIPQPPPQQAPQGASPAPMQPLAAAIPAPAAGGASPIAGKLALQPMIAQILAKSPNVANHPEILLAALNHAKDMGLLDPDAETEVDGIQKQHTMNRIATAKQHLKAVQDANNLDTPAPAAPAAPPPITATNPQTGDKMQFIGGKWQPMT